MYNPHVAKRGELLEKRRNNRIKAAFHIGLIAFAVCYWFKIALSFKEIF